MYLLHLYLSFISSFIPLLLTIDRCRVRPPILVLFFLTYLMTIKKLTYLSLINRSQ